MYTRCVLELFLYIAVVSASMPACDYTKGIQPGKVINSNYSIVNGTFCCPEVSNCTYTPEEMNCKCAHGLVDEPCRQCKTCGKTLGEVCGGSFGIRGECEEGFECTADSKLFLDGVNITGVCKHKGLRKEYESCDEINVCMEGFTCREVAKRNICIAGSVLKPSCTKDCKELPLRTQCGSDGKTYINNCAWRQMKCLGYSVSRVDCPDKYCQPLLVPGNASVKYSTQLLIDSIECDPGYEAEYSTTPNVHVEFPASLTCVCGSGECRWHYGPAGSNKEVTFEDLPKCVNSREKECQKRAESEASEDGLPKQELKNQGLSNLAA